MNTEEFEQQISRSNFRKIPAHWRTEIIASAAMAAKTRPVERAGLRERVAALLWPCPQAWAGLAMVWVVILTAAHFSREDSRAVMAQAAPESPEFRAAIREQRRELAQLIDQPFAQPAIVPRNFNNRPRSEIAEDARIV